MKKDKKEQTIAVRITVQQSEFLNRMVTADKMKNRSAAIQHLITKAMILKGE